MDEELTFKVVTVTGSVTSDTYGLSMIAKDAVAAKEDLKPEVEKLLVELEEGEE